MSKTNVSITIPRNQHQGGNVAVTFECTREGEQVTIVSKTNPKHIRMGEDHHAVATAGLSLHERESVEKHHPESELFDHMHHVVMQKVKPQIIKSIVTHDWRDADAMGMLDEVARISKTAATVRDDSVITLVIPADYVKDFTDHMSHLCVHGTGAAFKEAMKPVTARLEHERDAKDALAAAEAEFKKAEKEAAARAAAQQDVDEMAALVGSSVLEDVSSDEEDEAAAAGGRSPQDFPAIEGTPKKKPGAEATGDSPPEEEVGAQVVTGESHRRSVSEELAPKAARRLFSNSAGREPHRRGASEGSALTEAMTAGILADYQETQAQQREQQKRAAQQNFNALYERSRSGSDADRPQTEAEMIARLKAANATAEAQLAQRSEDNLAAESARWHELRKGHVGVVLQSEERLVRHGRKLMSQKSGSGSKEPVKPVQDAAAAAGRDNAAAASGVPAFDPSQLAGVVAQVKTAKSAGKQVQRHARLSRGRREAGERNDAAFHAMAASLGGGGNRITVNTLLQHGQAVRNAATEAQMQQDQEDRAQQRAGHVTAGHNRSHSHASGFRLGGRRDQVAPEGAGHCRSKSAPLPQKCSIM